jgi:hypothetical protein
VIRERQPEGWKVKDLTERDLEVLRELVYACDESEGGRNREWGVAPLALGGTGHSGHSYRLTKLARLGYAEHRQRGKDWGDVTTNDARGSKRYRPTDKGRNAAMLS